MGALPKLMFSDPSEIKTFRKKQGMNQGEFWARVGITQSGGSRYETGRNIPRTVQLLLHLAYAPDVRAQCVFDVLRAWKGHGSSRSGGRRVANQRV